jgi:hypothetical protein
LLTILPAAEAAEVVLDVVVGVKVDETEVTIGLLYAMLGLFSDDVSKT